MADIWQLRQLALASTRTTIQWEDERRRYTGSCFAESHVDSKVQAELLRACDRFIFGDNSIEVKYHDRWLCEGLPTGEHTRRLMDSVAHIWRGYVAAFARGPEDFVTFVVLIINFIYQRMPIGCVLQNQEAWERLEILRELWQREIKIQTPHGKKNPYA